MLNGFSKTGRISFNFIKNGTMKTGRIGVGSLSIVFIGKGIIRLRVRKVSVEHSFMVHTMAIFKENEVLGNFKL